MRRRAAGEALTGRGSGGGAPSLSRAAARRPRVWLAVLSVLTLGFGAWLPRLELQTDGAGLRPEGDPTVARTVRDRRAFGDPEEIVLLLTSRRGGPPVSSVAGLRALRAAHEGVAALRGVRADGVRSAASLVDVATSGVASLGRFLDPPPADRTELAAVLRRLLAQPWTRGIYLSADGEAAALYAPLETGRERDPVVAEVGRWAAVFPDRRFTLRVTGPAVAETALGGRILGDLARLVPFMVLVMAAVLLVCLRTPAGLLVALAKVLAVLVWTGGAMAMAGVPVTLVTTILPVLLLALSVTDEVHVLARFQERFSGAGGGGPDGGRPTVREEILATLGELRRPVLYTSVSTAIGLLSFLSASIAPLRHLGALAGAGILLAMGMTFTLTPALACVLPASWWRPRGPGLLRRRSATGRGLGTGRRRTLALAAGLALLLAAVPGLRRLTVQDAWIDNFDPASPLVRAQRELDGRFWGAYRFDVVLSGERGLFQRPAGAALAVAAARLAADAPGVGGVVTYLDPLDTVAELLGLSAGAAHLPADALAAVAEVGGLYAPEIDLRRLLAPDGHAARLLVLVHGADYRRGRALAGRLERALTPLAAAAGASYHASGDLPLALATVRAVVHDQLRSIAWTLGGVALLLLVASRKPWLTLVQLVPPTIAALLVLAGMGYAGLPLGVATSMFTALTLGVGVDLALHVTHAYERARSRGLAAPDAVAAAFEGTAAGRRWSTVVLAVGFLVLTASAFGPNHDLGLLLAAAMVAAHLATYLFVPGMLAP